MAYRCGFIWKAIPLVRSPLSSAIRLGKPWDRQGVNCVVMDTVTVSQIDVSNHWSDIGGWLLATAAAGKGKLETTGVDPAR